MNPLSEVLRSKRANDDRGLQRALREIDNRDLALSLLNIDEKEREIIYRNMTKHAGMYLKKGIEILSKRKIDDKNILEMQKIISDILLKFTHEIDKPVISPEKSPLPEINFDTYDDIIKTFENIGNYGMNYGLVALEGIKDSIEHVMFQKGIELITDGTHPMLVDELLENYERSMMHRYETKLNMIATGIKCVQMGDNPYIITEKLKSFIS